MYIVIIVSFHIGSPEIVLANVSEEVILNCTVSSSPDPVYSWSIPDSCSSCPNTNYDSVLIFTVDTTSGGQYICLAEDELKGNLSLSFIVIVTCK